VSSLTSDRPLDEAEIDMLEALLHDYGFDYRSAAVGWLHQKIAACVAAEQLQTVSGLRVKVFHDESCRQRLLESLTLHTQAMFHDPEFYQAFRTQVVPLLRTYPFFRIWHVGCATGEEVYAMAILLEEEGLYDRCRLYATDVDETALRRAREGIFSLAVVQGCTTNYLRSGGKAEIAAYCTASGDQVTFHASLKRNLIFAGHNLATDGPFNEFHAVVCRGVLPSLAPAVRRRAHELIRESLVRLGFLCLGASESIAGPGTSAYERISSGGIFRRIY